MSEQKSRSLMKNLYCLGEMKNNFFAKITIIFKDKESAYYKTQEQAMKEGKGKMEEYRATSNLFWYFFLPGQFCTSNFSEKNV